MKKIILIFLFSFNLLFADDLAWIFTPVFNVGSDVAFSRYGVTYRGIVSQFTQISNYTACGGKPFGFVMNYYNPSDFTVCVANNYAHYSVKLTNVVSNDGICPPDKVFLNGSCTPAPVCQFGYHNDTTPAKTCVPDKECPASMKYFAQATGTFSFDIKTCLPNRDTTPTDCASKGGTYASSADVQAYNPAPSYAVSGFWSPTVTIPSGVGTYLNNKIFRVYGQGCYDTSWLKESAMDTSINEALSFFPAKIDKAFLAQLGKSIYGAGKSLYSFFDDFFMASQDAINASGLPSNQFGLTKVQPNFVDVKIQPDGTYAVMDWQLRNEIWDDLGGGNVAPKLYPIDTPDIIPNNVYLGGDIYKVQSNLIGTKSYLDNPQVIPVPENLPINGVSNSTINLKNSLYGTETSPFNVSSTVLERSTPATGETLTKTVSKINYADGSYTEITSLERKLADATKTYEVTTKTPIETTNGIKVFENKTTYTQNSTGATTNIVNSPSTVSYVNSSGAVTTSTNSSVSNSNTISSTQSPINLSQLQAGLDKINKQLSDLDKAMEASVKPRDEPKSVTELKSAIENFKTGMSEYSGVLDNAVSFAAGMKDKMLGLEQQLNDALAVFDDKPQITVQSGSCPFTSHWYGKSVTVDPCMFVEPYRPILSAFLTLFMSFGVLMFCLKFFFRIGS